MVRPIKIYSIVPVFAAGAGAQAAGVAAPLAHGAMSLANGNLTAVL